MKHDWVMKKYDELINMNAKLFIFDQDYILLNTDANETNKKANKEMSAEVLIPIHKIPSEIFEASLKYYLGMHNRLPLYALESSFAEHKSENSLIRTNSKTKMLPLTRLESLPENTIARPLRAFLEYLDKELMLKIFRAKQLLHWHKTSQFCSACGGKTLHSETETAKICENCDRIIYPHTSPAIVVLIEKGEEILLARSRHFRPGVYSLLAGFVEAGESAEDTVRREIEEEVQIKVKNIRYFGSEPWPFENSFMIAFIAEYDSGDIIISPNEIEDARWFKWEELPLLPYKSSLSRQLIDAYIKEKIGAKNIVGANVAGAMSSQ